MDAIMTCPLGTKGRKKSIANVAEALDAGRKRVHADLPPHFSKAKAADLQEILESLVALGRARQDGERFSV